MPPPPPAQEPLPPITARKATLSVRAPGLTVVTSMLNGEYFSATRAQTAAMLLSSASLKLEALPSVSYAAVAVTLNEPHVVAASPSKSRYSLAEARGLELSKGTPPATATALRAPVDAEAA